MEYQLWHLGVLILFIIACSYHNYKSGVAQGVNATLDTLEKAKIININGVDIQKAVDNINKK